MSETVQLDISDILGSVGAAPATSFLGGRRFRSGDGSLVVDELGEGGISCIFARIAADTGTSVRIGVSGSYFMRSCAAGGWLLAPHEASSGDTYWVPVTPMLREVAATGHVLSESPAVIRNIFLGAECLQLEFDLPGSRSLDLVAWKIAPDEVQVLGELEEFLSIEKGQIFLWGSHSDYRCPADVYTHLIHGHVYETRFDWPLRRKICSENDAHALYVILSGLSQATGKRIYKLLKNQLVLSIIDRQGPDGGWRHGEWTQEMESHYRLHCSGMHLLMDALAEQDDPAIRRALEKAAEFIGSRSDRIDAGVWFLHDSLEHSDEAFRKGPFSAVKSTAFGKSASNMLVLNTHLDTSVALARYGKVTGDRKYAEKVASGITATRSVLAARPAEALYRWIFWAIGLTFLPTCEAEQLPVHYRAAKRIAWKYLIPRLPDIKARFPRFMMPGGYIERELTLRTWALDYHSINLMDLLRYYRALEVEDILEPVRNSLRFMKESGLAERLKELKGREYSLGFLAEALYLACLVSPEEQSYRTWLAKTMMDLEELQLGLPPSLLGGNAEAVDRADQVPSVSPGDARLRVANLCHGTVLEFLVVNPTTEAIPLTFDTNAPETLLWRGSDGAGHDGSSHVVPARGWLSGRLPGPHQGGACA